jgi:twinkle protein
VFVDPDNPDSEGRAKVTGFCFACSTYVDNPYGDSREVDVTTVKGKSEEEIVAEMEEINNLSVCDLAVRKLRANMLEEFGVKVGVSLQDGKTPSYVFFPYTSKGEVAKWKARLLSPKRMWSVGSCKDVDLFGWERALRMGSRRLIIVEGEFDAVALASILDRYTKEPYRDNIPAVCSLPHGAASAKNHLSRLLPKIRKSFKEVAFCFDDDEAGKKALKDCSKLMPEAQTIELPDKDANACIVNNKQKAAFAAAQFNSKKVKNTRIVWGRDVHESAKVPPEWGLSWPWEGFTDITRGIRFGETYYFAGAPKMGKSDVVNEIGEHLIVEHGVKCLFAKPEESNNKTYKLLLGKVEGKVFHDPKVEFDGDAYERAGKRIMDNMCMLDLYQNITYEILKEDIIEAASHGCKGIFVDPITNLTNGMDTSTANTHLQYVAQDLAALAKDLDLAIFIFCHVNKQAKGSVRFDRGGEITTDDFAGSSAMARSCNYAIALQGNKDRNLEIEQRNMRELVVLADREFGESGSIHIYWNYKTQLYTEVKAHD